MNFFIKRIFFIINLGIAALIAVELMLASLEPDRVTAVKQEIDANWAPNPALYDVCFEFSFVLISFSQTTTFGKFIQQTLKTGTLTHLVMKGI